MYPQDFYFTKEHEWVKVEGEKGIVGITDYAQKSLGDIVYVELPQIGKIVKFMETAGTI
jgi:glycine cleavage system H protein